LVEYPTHNRGATGSKPIRPIIFF